MLSLPRFFRDRRGVAAVEFAFVAPVLILIYMGLAEVTMALMAERRAGHATAAIADLIAQDTLTSKTEIDDIFALGDKIVAPFASDGLTLRVTAIQADKDGVPEVVWSRAKGDMEPLAKGDPVTGLPADLIAANETLIFSEMKYAFNSPVRYVIPDALTFHEKYYLRPRKLEMVNCVDC